jgi:hypothetical protein
MVFLEAQMLGARRGRLASVLLCLGVLAVAPPAAAQFVSPPPQAPVLPPNFSQQQIQVGQRCATSAGLCGLSGAYPVGSRCTCSSPAGPVYGQVVR